MKRKKIGKYILLLLTLGFVFLWYFSERKIQMIYGDLTEKVAADKFLLDAHPVLIKNISVLSEDGKRFIPHQSVLIKEGTIASIDSIIDNPPDAKIIDGTDKFLIPGLIDSHVHLLKSPNDLLLYIANGVTEIREMMGDEVHLQWRQEIGQGKRIGPDMYIASPRIASFGRVKGWFMNWTQGFESVSNEEEAKRLIEKTVEKGYDGIKIYTLLNTDGYTSLNELAPKNGLDVIGHIPYGVGHEGFLMSNQEEVAHLEELMKPILWDNGGFDGIKNQTDADDFLGIVDKKTKELAPRLAEKDIVVTTTLWLMESFVQQKFNIDQILSEVELVYVNPGLSEWDENIPGLGWLPTVNRYRILDAETLTPSELERIKIFWATYAEACRITLRNLNDEGVKILAGTDANVPCAVPGFSLHDELASLREAGMSPTEVLQSVTRLPGEWLGKNTGILKEGAKANLVILEENPLMDIANTRSINSVMVNGRFYEKSVLNDMLNAVKNSNEASRTVDIAQYTKK
ncbi:amidohydrolase family protein [Ulvibacterium sp.]|uniref:amidohydrolase family protein n=1 Tax=Ulvibacterium sp. TaxID=2665914 RepID=UPI003BAB50AD